MFKTNSGSTIKLARKSRGMTQAELAKKVGMHLQFISNIERGICLIPPKKVKKFSKTLHIWTNTLIADLRKDWIAKLDKKLGLK